MFSSTAYQAAKVRFEPAPLDKPDAAKQNFKDYLEKAGVKDALTRGLSQLMIALYRTPSTAGTETISFIKKAFGGEGLCRIEGGDLETLQMECAELSSRVEELTDENAKLKSKLAELETRAEVHWQPPQETDTLEDIGNVEQTLV